ncbi:glycosyltransferase family 4 protein [Burkholderia pyrrocinia]|uniref:glycosyltransferase family 4 protein n=1 Tax=Burkholderia pyrrocinia TaxID=60550 RepID=UPI00158A2558|nr:glycosyltransferase family 4 protein [Burkholderia pyrrocinia]
MKLLFVHQNFPGQFRHLASALARDAANQVVAMTMSPHPPMPGIAFARHSIPRPNTRPHRYLAEFETQVLRGQSAAGAALALREKGFVPDVIWAHPGWGEALFLKDIFPASKLVCYQEFFYRAAGSDVNFDPEYRNDAFDNPCHLRVRNSAVLSSLDAADAHYSPTRWQRAQFPRLWRDHIEVIHDGIDTDLVKPDASAWLTLKGLGRRLAAGDEVITFVNRNLEPYRGFPTFMRALPELLRRRPKAVVIIVGGDDVSYGQQLPEGQTYRKKLLEEVGGKVDPSRVRFVGNLPYAYYLHLLQISACHIYLTYPFVLSWSLLESMSAGAPVVASATAPVSEVIEDGVNGLLVDFFSPADVVKRVCEVLDDRALATRLRTKGRETVVERYDLKRRCLPAQIELLRNL